MPFSHFNFADCVTLVISEMHRNLFCRSLGLKRSVEPMVTISPPITRRSRTHEALDAMRWKIVIRPRSFAIPPGSLILGCQAGLEPSAFAEVVNDPRYHAMPMAKSPHVKLLQLAMGSSQQLSDEEIMNSEYWRLANDITGIAGEFFGATTEPERLVMTRNFIEWALNGGTRAPSSGGSGTDDGVVVARITGSSSFQIIDGHHRVAVATVRGEPTIQVRQTLLSTGVPL